jgi:hypothetical protein
MAIVQSMRKQSGTKATPLSCCLYYFIFTINQKRMIAKSNHSHQEILPIGAQTFKVTNEVLLSCWQ